MGRNLETVPALLIGIFAAVDISIGKYIVDLETLPRFTFRLETTTFRFAGHRNKIPFATQGHGEWHLPRHGNLKAKQHRAHCKAPIAPCNGLEIDDIPSECRTTVEMVC